VVVVAALASPQAPQATFRATIDLVAVDVQVVDRNGMPIPNLGPEKFEVSIDGRRRRVVSADFMRSVVVTGAPDPPGTNVVVPSSGAGTAPLGRVFMLAVDVNSFSVGDSRGVVAAATRFIKALQPDDVVGVFAFPLGPRFAPSADHVSVALKLDSIVGARQSMESSYHLSPAEIVDITAETAAITSNLGRGTVTGTTPTQANTAEAGALRRVQLRECGGQTDQVCAANIRLDAESMAYFYEGQATMAMSGLTSLVRDLSVLPGRKTVVLLSGGITASDRPGGRPNVDDLAQALGRAAAEANTSVYALHIDTSAVQSYSAEKRRTNRGQTSQERESVMLGRVLDMFSGASGGTMMRVLVGSGEGALDRVLRETSSHYLLGVLPNDEDRGRLRELRVKVSQPGVTVRSRLWVAIPKKKP
jgi:VWFA-related protein